MATCSTVLASGGVNIPVVHNRSCNVTHLDLTVEHVAPAVQGQKGVIPFGRIPISRVPLSRCPSSRIPFSRIPLSRCPYSRYPFGRCPLLLTTKNVFVLFYHATLYSHNKEYLFRIIVSMIRLIAKQAYMPLSVIAHRLLSPSAVPNRIHQMFRYNYV